MTIVDKTNYEKYLLDNEVDCRWQKRDFVSELEKYMDSSLNKVLLVSGLKGTGKSIGVLQAMQGRNAACIVLRQGVSVSAEDLVQVLSVRKETIIIVDGCDLVQDKRNTVLVKFFYRLVSHGKRVIITGSKPLCLEALKIGPLVHRTITFHTTYVSFSEYCRLYNKPMVLSVCRKYLVHGSDFREVTARDKCVIVDYVKDMVVTDLIEFVCNREKLLDTTKISNIMRVLVCKVVLDLAHCDSKFLQNRTAVSMQAILEKLSITLKSIQISSSDIETVVDLLCRIGVLAKIPNLLGKTGSSQYELFNGYRVFVVDSSLAYRIATIAFTDCGVDSILDLVYKANCAVDLYFRKQATDTVYYIEPEEADSYGNVIVISSNDDYRKKQFYLFECRYQSVVSVGCESLLVTSDKLNEVLKNKFPDSEVCGRFIIHPGNSDWQKCRNGTEVAIVKQDNTLYKYYKFDELRECVE